MTRGFFGYGSLVNTQTHDFEAAPARLHGWRRTWCATPARGAAFLSAEPATDGLLLGVTAPVPGNNWAELDQREASYDRVDVSDQFASPTVVYSVPQSSKVPAQEHRIWLSYLDVVLQGYLRVFGSEGPAHFMSTTDGWEIGIENDRGAPQYPRAQSLSASETAMVDELIAPYLR